MEVPTAVTAAAVRTCPGSINLVSNTGKGSSELTITTALTTSTMMTRPSGPGTGMTPLLKAVMRPTTSAPQEYRERYTDVDIDLRPNVPGENRESAAAELKSNYAHISALDDASLSFRQGIFRVR